MTDLTTPLAALTPVVTVGGKVGPIPDVNGADAMGLVTASPAAFSLLGRLKAIVEALLAKPGVGDLTAVPAGSPTGAVIGAKTAGARALRLYLPNGTSVSYTVASAAPSAIPNAVFTVSAADTGPNWDEPLGDGLNVYVTARTGAPLFRYL